MTRHVYATDTWNETIARRDNEAQEWNPLFVAYALAHHCDSPAEQLRRDRIACPGACMLGYITWMHETRMEFLRAHPEACEIAAGCSRPSSNFRILDIQVWYAFVQSKGKHS